ncbi:MAG: hypothetical protein AAF611_09655 [Bacteroidota bacterium]
MKQTMSILLGCMALFITLNSCGVGYLVGGKQTSYEGTYYLPIYQNIEASKSKLKSILFADGWNKVSEQDDTILFQNGSSKGAELGGKYSISNLKSVFINDKVTLVITQTGNFKFGTEKKTNETFAEIKEQYEIQ